VSLLKAAKTAVDALERRGQGSDYTYVLALKQAIAKEEERIKDIPESPGFETGDERRARIKKAMRDGQAIPLWCSCGGYLAIVTNCEGFQEECFCKSCGLMYNLGVVVLRLIAHHNYTRDSHGRLYAPKKEGD